MKDVIIFLRFLYFSFVIKIIPYIVSLHLFRVIASSGAFFNEIQGTQS